MSSPSRVKHVEAQQHAKTQHDPSCQSPEETLLHKAIEQASHTKLCQILRQLCAHSKTATEMTREHLITCPEKVESPKKVVLRSILKKPGSSKRGSELERSPPVEQTSASNATPPSSQMQSQGNAKRKASTQCRNCGFEYNPANADVLACTHHPGQRSLSSFAIKRGIALTSPTGKREVNSDHEVWDDFDPDVLGDAWTLMEYEEFASGFQWSCCKRDIDEKGCVLGKHEAAPVGEWKRARRC